MKIKKFYGDKHRKLYNLLPLSTPLSLMIDPANICNFQCKFCPTGNPHLLKDIKRPKGIMSYELFCKIIDDLTKFPNKLKRLHLYKDGEPLLNKNISKMVYYAKIKNISDSVEITTNASLLNEKIALELIESGLDKIRISVEHINNEGYKSITKKYSNYLKIFENIRFLYLKKKELKNKLHIHIKILDIGLTQEELNIFFDDYSNFSDSIFVDEIMGWSNSEKFDFTLRKNPIYAMDNNTNVNNNRLVCPQPFYTLSINFNGLISVCCVDWTMNTIVGDCKKEDLISIWNGELLKEFRLMHLDKEKYKNKACNNCNYLKGMSKESDIDPFINKLKKVYSV